MSLDEIKVIFFIKKSSYILLRIALALKCWSKFCVTFENTINHKSFNFCSCVLVYSITNTRAGNQLQRIPLCFKKTAKP